MSNGVIVKPVWLSLALVVAFSLVAPGIADRAAANELLQPQSDLDLQQSESASSCGECCCRRPKRVFFAGTEATFLVPNFSGQPMTFTVNDIGAGTTNVYSDGVTALDQMYVGPRVWLGVQGERWGVVTRFWELSDSQLAFDPLMPGETAGYTAAHRFDAYTLDLELTRRFCRGNSRMDFAVGVRYASIENDSTLSADEIIGIDLLSGSALATRQFDGTGITIGLEGRRPLKRQSNLYLLWKLRGSLMWGDIVNTATSSASYAGVGGFGYAFNGATASTSDDLFIGECQLGLQYERELRCLPATAFFRVVAEYQYWEANGGVAFASSGAGAIGIASGIADAISSDVRTNLVGFTLGTGLSW